METVPFTIPVTPEQKAQIQSLAEAEGLSAEKFALKHMLGGGDSVIYNTLCEAESDEFRSFIMPRIAEAKAGNYVPQSFDEIIEEVDAELDQ